MLFIIKNINNETGYEIKELDLGGGFGIYYKNGDAKLICKRQTFEEVIENELMI